MAIQTINIGTIANDGTGDDLREAFVKVNSNFTELNARSTESTTVANLGSAGEGVFGQISGTELQFKKIVAGTAISLAADANAITINSTSTGLPSVQIFADNNNITLDSNGNALTLAGGGTTTTNLSGTTLTISSVTSVQTDTDPKLTATLNAQTNDITNVGNMTGNVHGLDIRTFDGVQQYLTLDMGEAVPTLFTSTLEYLAHNLVVDFDDGNATFTASTAVLADMGTL
ncbi:hypothetical protein OAA22_00285 [bacterium]|jgi:hypothetical protein|nr:hypothetical protein [bacterium]|tara:strand:- start:4717 stop:5406 length:690 start_codon:yes stop_codon:yes gene_type:complete